MSRTVKQPKAQGAKWYFDYAKYAAYCKANHQQEWVGMKEADGAEVIDGHINVKAGFRRARPVFGIWCRATKKADGAE